MNIRKYISFPKGIYANGIVKKTRYIKRGGNAKGKSGNMKSKRN
jgi:hypothetical protein